MAHTVFPVGKIWHYRFQINGTRRQKSTYERNERKARAYAQAAYDDAVLRANGGRPTPTLSELITEWLAVRAPVSSAAHVGNIKTFAKLHLYGLGDLKVSAITTKDVEMARNRHLETHKPSSANHWLRNIRLLCNWGVGHAMLPKVPWTVVKLVVQKRPRPVLPVAQAMEWFAAIDKMTRRRPTVAIAIRLMFGVGLRESESASARWEWVDWERKTYTPGITKGREAVPVPMPDWLIADLLPTRRESGLIAANKTGRPFRAGFARRAMEFANELCKTPGITPHRLRGSFATLLSEAGVPWQTLQAMMRHKDPLTTRGYLETNHETAFQAQNKIGELIGFGRGKTGEAQPASPHTA